MFSAGRHTAPTREKYLSSTSALFWLQLLLSSPSPSLHPLKLSLSVHFMTNAALSLPRVLLSTLPRLHPLPLSLALISHFCPLCVIAFATLYFHFLFSSHSLQVTHTNSHTYTHIERPQVEPHRGVLFQKKTNYENSDTW